jgi:probable Rubsico expression protein CbbX
MVAFTTYYDSLPQFISPSMRITSTPSFSIYFNHIPKNSNLVNLKEHPQSISAQNVLSEIEQEFIGLSSVKKRLREICAQLVIYQLTGQARGLGLHMCFTGAVGMGKSSVARYMAELLYNLGYSSKGHLITATREDLVGQYIGHTAPKTKEVLKRAMGGVLFVDEAYSLYRPENERDYGVEALEILLQVMENHRKDLVVIFAGYADKMDTFFKANPGLSSRVTHHVHFIDHTNSDLVGIAQKFLNEWEYRFGPSGEEALTTKLDEARTSPLFANARTVKNILEKARIQQARRISKLSDVLTKATLVTIQAEDILSVTL